MKSRTIILTLTAAAILAAPGLLFAQQGPGSCDGDGPHGPNGGPGAFGGPGGPGGPGRSDGPIVMRMLHRFGERLDLTDAQLTQIDAIAEAGRTEAEPLMDQLQTERQAFRDSHEIGDFDESSFRAHFEQQAELQVELKLIGARTASEAWSVLTVDQQQELLEIMELLGPGNHGPRNGGNKRHGRH